MNIIGIRGTHATIITKDEFEKDHIIAAIKKVGRHRTRIHEFDGKFFLTVTLDIAKYLDYTLKKSTPCE